MQTLIKLLTVILILNIFMYIGINFSISAEGGRELNKEYNFHFEGDLIDQFIQGSNNFNQIAQDTKENWTSYGIAINSNFSGVPSQQTGTVIGEGVNFLDSLKIVWNFVKMLFNIVTAPLTLFFNFRMPVFIGLMIGLPYFFVLVLSIFAFIRGVGD